MGSSSRVITSALAIVVVALTAGCTQRHVRHWHELHVGMDKRTVGRLLGTPTAKMGPVTKAAKTPQELFMYTLFYGEVFDREGWVYNRPGLLAALDNLFGPSVDAHVVYFDHAGRVEGWREPLTKGDPRPGATQHAFWRRYRELVCAADGAVRPVEGAFKHRFLPAADPAPEPRSATCDARGVCRFEWDAPPQARSPAPIKYWVQIGLSEGESPTTAPIHELEPLTFATPRTTMHLDFGFRPVPEPLAWWRVRAVHGTTASEWSAWKRIEMVRPSKIDLGRGRQGSAATPESGDVIRPFPPRLLPFLASGLITIGSAQMRVFCSCWLRCFVTMAGLANFARMWGRSGVIAPPR